MSWGGLEPVGLGLVVELAARLGLLILPGPGSGLLLGDAWIFTLQTFRGPSAILGRPYLRTGE